MIFFPAETVDRTQTRLREISAILTYGFLCRKTPYIYIVTTEKFWWSQKSATDQLLKPSSELSVVLMAFPFHTARAALSQS